MSEAKLFKYLAEIDEQLEKIKDAYGPFVGMRYDSLTTEELNTVSKLTVIAHQLIAARCDICRRLTNEFGIFVL